MKEIPLTQKQVAIVGDKRFDYLNQWKWCAIKSRNTFYAIRNQYRYGKYPKMVIMHRVIMNDPLGVKIDHRDGIGTHNWEDNLRIATHIENIWNQPIRTNNSSGFKGVCWHKATGKWNAKIGVRGVRISLGYFDDVLDAACTYNEAAIKYFGEFAWLNEIPESFA